MTGKLHGKTIVVTGAARGLGALFCHAIADAGGTILALGRDEAALAAMIADLSGTCLLYTSPSPRDGLLSRMPSSA